ncbi:MAG: helix-turn-helix transcriptional regulator [Synergistaceae bacterium]|nr:helix-turn-helix transcriptional regulator [Synergistaceae bacterium]
MTETKNLSLPERIRAEMKAQRYSGRALGRAAGVDCGLLSRYFNGKSDLSLKSLEAVLGVLGYELSMRKKTRKS